MSRTVVLVTGANTGLGLEIVKALLESGRSYHILLGSRSLQKARTAIEGLEKGTSEPNDAVDALQVDLNSDQSIREAVEQVKAKHDHIDVLINNAGAAFDAEYTSGKLSLRETFTNAYDVNVAGTHVLTCAFAPLLLASEDPRLIFISGLSHITRASQHYFPTPPQPAGWPKQISFETIGYRCSKMALSMLMVDWAHKLKADGVKVWAVAPGLLVTDLGGQRELAAKMGAEHPNTGGRLLRTVVEGERDGEAGNLINKDGIIPF